MILDIPKAENFIHELVFLASRSSGPGGQNVNKVNSKVTLKFNIVNSQVLLPEQKELILKKLSARLTKDGVLMLTAQDNRSQLENKAASLSKLNQLLIKIFTPTKPRKATKPSKAARRARIDHKRQQAEKKKWRQKPD